MFCTNKPFARHLYQAKGFYDEGNFNTETSVNNDQTFSRKHLTKLLLHNIIHVTVLTREGPARSWRSTQVAEEAPLLRE